MVALSRRARPPRDGAGALARAATETKKGAQICHLTPEDKPEAVFFLAEGDEPVAVYEYCNPLGLWKAAL